MKTTSPGKSSFADGDWNGAGDFTSSDIMLAFTIDGFVTAVPPKNAVTTAQRHGESLLPLSEIAAIDRLHSDREQRPINNVSWWQAGPLYTASDVPRSKTLELQNLDRAFR